MQIGRPTARCLDNPGMPIPRLQGGLATHGQFVRACRSSPFATCPGSACLQLLRRGTYSLRCSIWRPSVCEMAQSTQCSYLLKADAEAW